MMDRKISTLNRGQLIDLVQHFRHDDTFEAESSPTGSRKVTVFVIMVCDERTSSDSLENDYGFVDEVFQSRLAAYDAITERVKTFNDLPRYRIVRRTEDEFIYETKDDGILGTFRVRNWVVRRSVMATP